MAARKLADRQPLGGWGGQSVKTYKALSKKFPDDLAIKNEFGVSYMMIGQNERAGDIFKETKTFELAVKYLREGIDLKKLGTSDGRLYLHLGNSLQRLGQESEVKFSVMSPGIHVWPHFGPTNCRIRAHLGLVVPEGPVIRFMNETSTWKEGEFIIFDDSFENEIWHEGYELCLVLIMGFWHPELTEHQRRRLSAI